MQLHSIVDSLLAIVVAGDANPLHNLPGRPLVDAFSGLFMLVGLADLYSCAGIAPASC